MSISVTSASASSVSNVSQSSSDNLRRFGLDEHWISRSYLATRLSTLSLEFQHSISSSHFWAKNFATVTVNFQISQNLLTLLVPTIFHSGLFELSGHNQGYFFQTLSCKSSLRKLTSTS
jgi:hypothetical protein